MVNTAAADSAQTDPVTDTVTTPVARSASILLDKQAGAVTSAGAAGPVGDTIAYSFVVTNTGNVPMDPITVSDNRVTVTCAPGALAPGATRTCTGTYTISQGDVDAGSVINNASATGTPPAGVTPPTPATDSTTTPIAQNNVLVIDKQAGSIELGPNNRADAGDIITWPIVVTNDGTTTLTGVVVTDTVPAGVTVSCGTFNGSLAPGASVTCTATKTLTQADITAGQVVNTATADSAQTDPVTDTVTTPVARSASILLDKQAGAVTSAGAAGPVGDTIAYNFVVTNTGNVSLDPVTITDAKVGPVTCTVPAGGLAPGASLTCSKTYTVIQGDVDAGTVNNTATASGTPPVGVAAPTSLPDSTTTPIAQSNVLVIDKQVGTIALGPNNRADAGDIITWPIVVTNDGTTTLTGVVVTDPRSATISCPQTTLAPGASVTCTATATLTQAEVTAGEVVNTATADSAQTDPVSDTVATPIPRVPSIALDKQAAAPVAGGATGPVGDTIAYSFVVTNTGNVPMDPITVSDNRVTVTCAPGALAPGATRTCTGTYTISQGDVDAGSVINNASATGTPPAGVTPPTPATDSTTTPIAQNNVLVIDKQAGSIELGPNNRADAGDIITWPIVVTNDGTTTLTGVVVTDPRSATISCPETTLAPGASVTCTATATLTQAEVTAGEVVNTATADSAQTGPVTDTVTTPVARTATFTFDKQAGDLTPAGADGPVGDAITYSFLVTNDGNVPLNPVTVADDKVTVTCPAGQLPLAPGGSITCTAPAYVVTQADVDAGSVINTATADVTPPAGVADPPNQTDSTTTVIPQNNVLVIDKQAGSIELGPNNRADAGDTITWPIVVTNDGTTTLTGVVVTDPRSATISCPQTTLAPGASVTCTATATLTQAEVTAGEVVNTATADSAQTGPVTDTVTTPVARTATFTFDKQAGDLTPAGADGPVGDAITYSFLVTNDGNVPLNPVTVADDKVTVTCPAGQLPLAPGGSITCTAPAYVVTQADVDAGSVINTATADVTPPAGVADPPNQTDSTTTTLVTTSSIVVDKTASPSTATAAGEPITYTFTGTNTGQTTLTLVSLADPIAGLSALTCDPEQPLILAPGETFSCTATRATTQGDVDAGQVTNTVTITGTPPAGPAVTDTDSATVTIAADPEIALDKQAEPLTDPDGNGPDLGDTITYSFLVTNAGNVTLDPVTVADTKVGAVTCPAAPLAPNASVTCTATPYALTQADLVAGSVVNNATASGTPPTGPAVTATDDTTTTVSIDPEITLTKTADPASAIAAGDDLTYTFTATNTGNVQLDDVEITDPLVGLSDLDCDPPQPATLIPGETLECTATYEVTQEDADAAEVRNTATVAGTDPLGDEVSDDALEVVTISPAPGINLVKTADPTTATAAGEPITYTFVATNTGNVTLGDVEIIDPIDGISPLLCDPTQPATLAPGETMECTATRATTQADVNRGSVVNRATVTGADPNDTVVRDADDATVSIADSPAIELTKTATPTIIRAAGQTITYDFVARNTGNVTLSVVQVIDPLEGLSELDCNEPLPTTLDPREILTCSATYVVTQADINNGGLSNTATGSAFGPEGQPVSDDDSVTVSAPANPAIELEKTAVPSTATNAGDQTTYRFVSTNTGNVTLDDVAISDPIGGLSSLQCDQPATLEPGETLECTATRDVTQAEVDAGSVLNTAAVTGSDPNDTVVEDTDPATVTIDPTPAIELDKQSSDPTPAGAPGPLGDTIAYTFLVQNTGNVTLEQITVTDAKVGDVSCPPGPLAPGETATCTATYTVTQADVDAGSVNNTATATGTPPPGVPAPTSEPDTTSEPIAQTSTLAIDKRQGTVVVGANGRADAGDEIRWTIFVTNTGTTTLTGVTVSDTVPAGVSVSCGAFSGTLAPGGSTMCLATKTLTQDDLNAGEVVNTATADSTQTDQVSDTVTTPVARTASIALDKQAGDLTAAGASGPVDDTIAYTFLVTNTGNVPLGAVAVSDDTVGAVTCPPGELAPGESTTCTATYTLTQDDVDAGSVLNTATASGTPPEGVPAPTSEPDSTTTPIAQNSAIEVVKTASPETATAAGEPITYTFAGTNIGETTLRNVSISDSLEGLSALTCTPAQPLTLAPGDSYSCTATRSTTQRDVNAGSVTNTATITGTPPTGPEVSDTDDATVGIAADPDIELDKQAGALTDPDGNGPDVGDTITYTFVVTNSGNVTLEPITVTDAKVGAVTCPAGPLTPNEIETCTAAPYTLTRADLETGQVDNTATASGTPPIGDPVTATSSTMTQVPIDPAISLTKAADVTSVPLAGETLTYTFTATNTGNVALDDVAITDPLIGLSALDCDQTAPATLNPGEDLTCTATYEVTQADADAGRVDNTATVSGVPPVGDPVTATATESVTVPAAPAIRLEKTADPTTATRAGEEITYTFEATNTGNVTLSGVEITDPIDGLSALDCVPGAPASLAPSETLTCTATRLITQGDVNDGSVANIATVTGTPPVGDPVTADDVATVTLGRTPAIEIQKTAEPTVLPVAGETVTYTFVATNTGNTTLTSVVITDPLDGLQALDCDPGQPTTLEPTETLTCTADYEVTQADADAGRVDNTATVRGVPPVGDPVTATATETVTVPPTPSIVLEKTADPTAATRAGEEITYTFEATNTGNVTLNGVRITDPIAGLSTLICDPTQPATLAPGETLECSATRSVTQDEVNAGGVVNTATVTGAPPVTEANPDPDPVTDTDDAEVMIDRTASFGFDKREGALTSGGAAGPVGDTITYTFVVTNTGNVSLDPVAVSDAKVGAVTCPAGSQPLQPGESITCTAAPYVVSQADVDAGTVNNTATADVTAPAGVADPLDVSDDTSTPLGATNSIEVVKTASPATATAAGQVITYTFEGTNTGQSTLSNVSIADPIPGLSALSCAPGQPLVLAPGDSYTCTATRTTTQADVDAGRIDNTATITGTPPGPNAPAVTDTDDAEVMIDRTASFGFDKREGALTSGGAAGPVGDTITYTFVVTNTGNVSLDPVAVSDAKVGAVTCPAGSQPLQPGESITCTAAPYVVSQADVDAGTVNNTATADVTAPAGVADPLDVSDDTSTPLGATNSIEVVKTASPATVTAAGQVITYTFEGTNTGQSTLSNVSIADPIPGLSALSCAPGQPLVLAPGDSYTCTATRTTTQADVDAGRIDNTATITGTPPGPNAPAVTDTDDAEVMIDRTASFGFDKREGALTSGGAAGPVGDTITYTFVVTNTGNVSLDPVAVSDAKVGAVTCPAGSQPLQPGESITCTAAPYVVSQADVDAGTVNNTATADVTAPAGVADPLDVSDDTSTPLGATNSIEVVKTASPATVTAAGQVITYTFEGTNTGQSTLSNVSIADPIPGLSALSCAPGQPLVLAPGDSYTCTATRTTTQADVDAGRIDNTATITGTPPGNAPAITASDDATVTIPPNPVIGLDKQAGAPVDVDGNGIDVGDTITYAFVVDNIGNVTLDPVIVTDPKVGTVTCPAGPLAPADAPITCTTAAYTLTQADVDAGTADNTATATGTSPGGTEVTDTDVTVTPLQAEPLLGLTKSADLQDGDGDDKADVGETIFYSFTVSNIGNVTLTELVVNDPLAGTVTCDPTRLAPGEESTCSADEAYVVSQADVNSGGDIVNTATATGVPPTGPPVTSMPDSTQTPVDAAPGMELVKDSELRDRNVGDNTDGEADAGEVIIYTFTVTNTGTTTLTGVRIDDPMLSAAGERVSCPKTVLDPAESIVCRAEHRVTAAEAAKDEIVNVATAQAMGVESDQARASTPMADVSSATGPTSPGGPGLPDTGGPRGLLLWLGAGLTLAGMLLLVRTRRRRA